ncbi:MAG TPA: hypothetical protein VFB80_18625, partial [Pirellulaceae bacterium]|nr:hypothetical protein [Pirellulaceae bacterium]
MSAGCDTTQLAQQVAASLDTHESLIDQLLTCEEAYNDVLAGVTDANSAREATARIKGLAEQYRGLAERHLALMEKSPGDPQRLNELYGERYQKMLARQIEERVRIGRDRDISRNFDELEWSITKSEYDRKKQLIAYGIKLDANGKAIAPAGPPGPPPPPSTASAPTSDIPPSAPPVAATNSPLDDDPKTAAAQDTAAAPTPAADAPPSAAEQPAESRPPGRGFGGGFGSGFGAPGPIRPPFRPGPPPELTTTAVTIILLRRPADGGQKLERIIGQLGDFKRQATQTTNSSFRMTVAPVGDLREFAKQLTWAKIASLDEDARTITIEIDPAKYP